MCPPGRIALVSHLDSVVKHRVHEVVAGRGQFLVHLVPVRRMAVGVHVIGN